MASGLVICFWFDCLVCCFYPGDIATREQTWLKLFQQFMDHAAVNLLEVIADLSPGINPIWERALCQERDVVGWLFWHDRLTR